MSFNKYNLEFISFVKLQKKSSILRVAKIL
jgi:hypothetical protein